MSEGPINEASTTGTPCEILTESPEFTFVEVTFQGLIFWNGLLFFFFRRKGDGLTLNRRKFCV